MNKSLHRKLMTLLSKAGFDNDMRHEMVYYWTDGRTTSTKDLSELELFRLINRIESDPNFGQTAPSEMAALIRQKRSKVLAIATRTGIFPDNNWDKFNSFMLKSSVLHKPLNAYTLTELDRLIKQFRGIEYHNKKARKNKAINYPYSLN
jgi:hypothetical protein